MDIINDYLRKYREVENHLGYEFKKLTPKVKCADGFSMSVQASWTHYCSPRRNDVDSYDCVEVGYPSAVDDLLTPYAENPEKLTDTVYGYVPIGIVNQVIEKHGGLL